MRTMGAARIAVAAMFVSCLVVPAVTPVAARASESCISSQLQRVPGGNAKVQGSVPVVFIHGIISKAQMWNPTTPGSIAYQAARLRGITAWTFGYEPESLDWVKNRAIGPAFATALSCLAHDSGQHVIVVAHSMGGLATQYALASPDPFGGTVGDHVAEVITVGTPYKGSELLTAMQLARHQVNINPSDWAKAALGKAVLSACAGHVSGICALPAVLPSQVGTDLELNSAAIQQLPAWPAGLPVLDIAGDMGLRITVGPLALHRFDVGDVAVTVGSATAHNTAGTPVIKHCNSLKLLGAIYGNPGPCFHSNLVNDADIITTILDAIKPFANVTEGDTSWPALSEPGFQGSACNLLPPKAFPAAGVTVVPSYVNPGATMDSGIGFLSGTDGSGNATCQEYWQDAQGRDHELAIDYLEKTTQATIWSYTDPPETPHDYAAGPPGSQYSHFVSGGEPGIEVNAPHGTSVIDILGYSGLTLPQLANLLKIALDRATRYAPTNTLYGVGA